MCEKSFTTCQVRSPDYGESMEPGDEVPDFELPDQTGTPRRLSTLLADGPVVLFFYPAAMTTGCTKEACHFRDLAAEFRAAGVQRVGISRDRSTSRSSSPTGTRSTTRCSPTSTARSPTSSASSAAGSASGSARPVKRCTFAIGTDRKIVAAIHSETNMDKHADEALSALAATS